MAASTELTTLSASQSVMARAADVSICEAGTEALAANLVIALAHRAAERKSGPHNSHWLQAAPSGVLEYLDALSHREQVLFVLVFHAAGFSYWQDPPWSIKNHDTTYNGSSAWLICLTREKQLLEPAYLANLSDNKFRALTLGLSDVCMPMTDERLKLLRALGKLLVEQNREESTAQGAIQGLLMSAGTGQEAPSLAVLLAETLPGFDDISRYDELTIPFLKRAQILINDISYLKLKQGLSPISGLDKLTAFADYKIPQLLRYTNVLRYSQNLAEKVDALVPLPPGSKEEVEIRAATIVAVEEIKKRVSRLFPIDSGALDNLLWLEAQKGGTMQPYHRCRTIYY